MKYEKQIIESLLDDAGVTINGCNPYDPQIHEEAFYDRVLRQGSLGLGESYMDGWWDCESIDQFIHRIMAADLDEKVRGDWRVLLKIAMSRARNPNRKSKAFEIGERHYDIGNDLYQVMLDQRLTYTCGYWQDAEHLDDAQEAKLDLVCRKIGLQPGQRVLDIGSGWGSFLGCAAEKYGAEAVGVTVSKEQKKLADKIYKDLPVETRLQDYRDIDEQFDHLVSLGMFEHVGHKNYRTFMKVAHDALVDDGLFLLHTIGSGSTRGGTEPWLDKYIFPAGMLPSMNQINEAVDGLFVVEDWHNFGADYDKTLMAWHANFEDRWNELKDDYNEKFYRMWRYFLLTCAGSFRARKIHLWQIVLSKNGVTGGYQSVR